MKLILNKYIETKFGRIFVNGESGNNFYDSSDNTYTIYINNVKFEIPCKNQPEMYTQQWINLQRSRAMQISENLYNKYIGE